MWSFFYRPSRSELQDMTTSRDMERRRIRSRLVHDTHLQEQRRNIPVINTPRISPEQIAAEIKSFNERILAKQDVTNQLLARQFDDGKVGQLVELFGEDPKKKRTY